MQFLESLLIDILAEFLMYICNWLLIELVTQERFMTYWPTLIYPNDKIILFSFYNNYLNVIDMYV